ncbi:cytidylyltransferase domain-containing protein [Flavilitoribacter nigricans]|uniref:Uncharacterized protein n=1 Tax=Flavilitoribacter nigricans (strain ATCC 23147 / DSM 23189 / NBRC 102662 / NCIMB 1420 / SS-2) TaxID=1122177 RepID=A0A2D0NHB7_FLAN2|nr:NTP transferase domain-containing protein [Flavilitoribacter nigricans]PHN07569.1 hypothetical protein CRP01_05565 [Flavilitoribacter nigricans DSM 23189 = NBRC 102662]
MTIGIAVLCRYSSSRLPGKVLMPIGGKPVLQHIIDRLQKLEPHRPVVVATSEESSDDAIAAYCEKQGIDYFRGSLTDVAGRFLSLARQFDWDYVVRINGDNLFIDLEALQFMIEKADTGQYDFVSSVKDRTFPFGMSIEIVRTAFYANIVAQMTEDRHREHVTLFLYDHPELGARCYHFNTTYPGLSGLQMAIDTRADFERAEQILDRLGDRSESYDLGDLAKILQNL